LHLHHAYQATDEAADVELALLVDESPDLGAWSVPRGESDQTSAEFCGFKSG